MLDTTVTLAGVPISEVRTLLKRCNGGFRLDWLHDRGLDERTAKKLAKELIAAGYVELDTEKKDKSPWYKTTELGKKIARASAAKRLTRKHAESAVEALRLRAETLNENPAYLMSVSELVIFGSFAAGAESLGDVDIAYRSERKLYLYGEDFEQWRKAASESFELSGRTWKTAFDDMYWPEKQLLLCLKNKQRTFSLHQMDEFIHLQSERRSPYVVLIGNKEEIEKQILRVQDAK